MLFRSVALYEQGAIAPLVSATVGLEDVPGALARLARRGTWGKVVCEL